MDRSARAHGASSLLCLPVPALAALPLPAAAAVVAALLQPFEVAGVFSIGLRPGADADRGWGSGPCTLCAQFYALEAPWSVALPSLHIMWDASCSLGA